MSLVTSVYSHVGHLIGLAGVQKTSAEETEAVTESVRKKLKTGREKLDRIQQHERQPNASEQDNAQTDDRL